MTKNSKRYLGATAFVFALSVTAVPQVKGDELGVAASPAPVSATTAKDSFAAIGKDESVASYERKSVTYLEMLDHTSADSDMYRAVEAAVRKNVELPRFDYNDVSRFRSLTPAEAARLVKDYLDKVKLERAREQAEYDVRFKDFTITGEDLRRISKSAYLYQPTLHHAQAYKERFVIYQNGYPIVVQRWVAKVGVSVRFFNVDFQTGTASEMATISATGSGSATIGSLMSAGDARMAAIREAAGSAGMELSKEVRGIDAFNLLTPISAASFNSVNFGLSRKEGLKLGQGFYVYDYLTTGGRERVGYVKVTRVGDGAKVLDSEAQNITVSNGFSFDEGQLLQEHPQHGIKIIPYGGLQNFKLSVDPELGGPDSASSGARFGVQASYDIGDDVGIPEVFATLRASAMASSFFEYGVDVGLEKRFYLRRFVLTPGAQLGILRNHWSFTPENTVFDEFGNPEDLRNMVGSSVGVTPRLGAEIFLNPEWSLLANGAYRLFTPQTGASLSNPDTDASFDFDGFTYNPSGAEVTFGVSYTF